MSKSHGRFVWFELITPEIEAGSSFWSAVGGLTATSMEMGGKAYPMLAKGEAGVAGVTPPPMDGVPPHWLSYWSVDDVDARTARVAGLGGKVVVTPTDLPGVGRFSVIADPQGGTVALFQGTGDDRPSAFHWNELHTSDAAAAVAFYRALLDLEARTTEMPTGPYHVLSAGGTEVAGVMAATMGEPTGWLPYLGVEDVDAAVSGVAARGGAVHAAPMSVPGVGRFAVVADRQGAALGLLAAG